MHSHIYKNLNQQNKELDKRMRIATREQKISILQSANAQFYGKWEKIIPTEIIWVVRPQENFKSTESTEAVSLNTEPQL